MKSGAGPIAWDAGAAREIIARRLDVENLGVEGAMLPILHDLQGAFGYIDAAAVPLVAQALNVSVAETYGVIAFYHDFRLKPPTTGRIIQVCRAEACQAVGCEATIAEACALRGLRMDEEPPGASALKTVYCLGNCALGPAAMVEGEIIGRLTAEALVALIDGRDVHEAQASAGDAS